MSGPEPDDDAQLDARLEERLAEALGHDPAAVPPPERIAALRAAAERMRATAPGDGGVVAMGRRPVRRALLTGGAAAGVGAIAGYLARRETEPAPAAGPPTEPITFQGPADVTRSELINHTWGTELVIDVSGLEAGSAYDVVYDTASGDVAAGSLLAVAGVLMKCRFNAAPLRADVRAIEVRSAGGDVVLRSQLPAVST